MTDDRTAVKVLQFLVGALVTFGGASFAAFAINAFGTLLGLIHLSIGVAGLVTGILISRSEELPRRLLIAVNAVTIVYSASSESLVEAESLLPSFAATGSLIGTGVALIMSAAIIYLLLTSTWRPFEGSRTPQAWNPALSSGLMGGTKRYLPRSAVQPLDSRYRQHRGLLRVSFF